MVSAREVRELLNERSDLEPALEAVLDHEPPWRFDEVDVDSGRFGELVSRGVVEEVDGGYRVANRSAVRQALEGEISEGTSSTNLHALFSSLEFSRLELAAVSAVLGLVVLLRLTSYPTVFQGDAIVLSSNDPYYYRYWLEQLLNDPETTFSSLPGGVTKGEPLLLASLWLVTVALGGTVEIAAQVLAWYPIVSALVTAILVYAIAVLITDDRRIGLASVTMLAVLPGHAFRTSVGFADHHAFDYPWLALTLLGAVLVTVWAQKDRTNPATVIGGVAAVVMGVTGQTLAWEAGPLLIVPLSMTIGAMTVTAVHREDSVIKSAGPLLLGIGLAAVLTWFLHTELNWHTTLVATAPLLLAAGGLGLVLTGVIWRRLEFPVVGLVAFDAVVAVAGAFVFRSVRPEMWSRILTQVTDRLLARREIAEVQSLFSDSAGWLLLFGFLLLLALPYMVWASHRMLDDDRWTPLVIYAWYFFFLAVIQVRFVGELSPFIAIFAGLGFVHLAEWIDVADRPAPFSGEPVDSLHVPCRRQAFTLVGLFLLVAGLSIVQVPVKTSQVTAPNDGYDAAAWMSEYSAEHDMEYPENYVFSQWGHNRMFNYFVNGQSRSYGYALANYVDFVAGSNATEWYERLNDRVGFIVTNPGIVSNQSTIGTRLHKHNGSRSESTPGLAHYRLVHVEKGGQYKVFMPVQGAVITGQTSPNATVTVRTTVELESDSFEYVRETTADENGSFSVRVANPGTYEVAEETVQVTETDVKNGTTVKVESAENSSTNSIAVKTHHHASDSLVREANRRGSIDSLAVLTKRSIVAPAVSL